MDPDSSEEESRKLVLELLDEYAFIRDRPLNDGESEQDRQRALPSARRRMTLSKHFRETMDRTKQERLDEYERKMEVNRRALDKSLGDVFAAARETSSAGRLADQRGGSSIEEGPNSAAKAKSTGTSVAKGKRSAVKKLKNGASSKRKRAPRDSRSADWDPERAYEGAFKDDAADRDDSDDEDYVPDAEDDRTVTEARGHVAGVGHARCLEKLQLSGSSAKGILAYLRKRTGKKTALRDVHNMLQAIRSERRGDTTDATRTEYVLREFVSQEKGNSATIFVDSDTQQAHVVVFQSARMKRLFQAFPEVVLVDTTHGTNANQYKLFSFAVTDFFERGQYVQHALVLAETKDNLRLAIECFQRCNPAWAKIRVFVTDKAFHEKDVLFENFPQTRQLLCTFHVIAWLERQAGRLSTGTADHKDKLKATLTSLVTAKSETEYMSKEKRICCSYYMETKITSSIARSSITGTAAELNGCCTNEVMFPTWETTPITV
ncbi:hypothetical protein PR003_g21906 [Phytophthora rubi]|uniref:ZSWIM1/3 RNaseH-like domain-containing protein n=1 Tax=Phytophthora rubi TaxID=129364 RepID=A0A6A4D9B1_9STRA|nr:hypothetical protein PR003_g21906 [Phytophthora rubi]